MPNVNHVCFDAFPWQVGIRDKGYMVGIVMNVKLTRDRERA